MTLRLALTAFVLIANVAFGEDFATRIVDDVGNPVAGVAVRLQAFCKLPGGEIKPLDLANLTTNAAGKVSKSYKLSAECAKAPYLLVTLTKEGFYGYAQASVKPEYVLHGIGQSKEISQILALKSDKQRAALRTALLSEEEDEHREEELEILVLTKKSLVHDSLIALATKGDVQQQASMLVASIAVQEDMAQVLLTPPKPAGLFKNRWIYSMVTGLIEPTTDAEWELLKRAAQGDYDDGWVDAGAIQSLRLNASARGRTILQKVADKNPDRKKMIDGAIAYIDAGAKPIAGTDLIQTAKKAALAIGLSGWQGNKKPRYSENGDVALIDSRYIIGRDLLVYTMTFHRVDNQWRLRGVKETMQALLAMDGKAGAE